MLRFALITCCALSLSAADVTPAVEPGQPAADAATPADGAKPAAAAAPADASSDAAPSPLAGKNYAITLTSSDGEKNEDVLIFAGDTLSSQGYADSRFNPGKVTVKDKGETRSFEAIMISPRGSEAIWTGKVTGDAVEGKVQTGVKGRFDVSTFTGTLQK